MGMCEAGESGNDIVDLHVSVERVLQRSRQGRTPDEIRAELVDVRHVINLLELEFSATASEFASSDDYEKQGSVSPISWMRHECNMTATAAASAIHVGDQAEQLPKSITALRERRIGFAHLALLAGTAAAVLDAPGNQGFNEEPLLRKAEKHGVNRFRRDCAHARHAADMNAYLNEHLYEVDKRCLQLIPCSDEILVIRGIFDPVSGAAIRSALEPLARPLGSDDTRDRERRLADALVELATHGLDAGVIPERASQRPHLQVTASLETLRGLIGSPAGEMEYSSPIPAATVQRLACDASIVRVLLGPDSAILDVGRARRLPSGATRRALATRDKGCVWPDCDRPVSWTAAHHLNHWAHGGTTDLNNLALICHRHHWMVHEGGWQVARSAEGDFVTVPPLPETEAHAREPAFAA